MPSQELFDRAYSQRAIAVKLLVVLASRLGYGYGWGIDDNESWEPEWRKVMYVQMPEGQFSWHIAPQDQALFDGVPNFSGKWDGTFLGRDLDFVSKLETHHSALIPGWEYEYKDVKG